MGIINGYKINQTVKGPLLPSKDRVQGVSSFVVSTCCIVSCGGNELILIHG